MPLPWRQNQLSRLREDGSKTVWRPRAVERIPVGMGVPPASLGLEAVAVALSWRTCQSP